MSSRGLSAPGAQKVKKESKKSQNSWKIVDFDSFSTPLWTFWAPGSRGPGNSFRTLLATLGPKGPNDPCSRARESQRERNENVFGEIWFLLALHCPSRTVAMLSVCQRPLCPKLCSYYVPSISGKRTGYPRRGPKDWKNSRFRSGIEIFKRPISDRNLQSRLKISSEPHSKAPFCGELTRLGLKVSSEIEIFNRDWKFQACPDPPTLAFLEKKQGKPRKMQGVFSSRNPSNPWKRKEKRTKKQGKSENEKSKEIEKSKDWRVRVDWKLQSYGLKISWDQSGLNFFNRRALWEGTGPAFRISRCPWNWLRSTEILKKIANLGVKVQVFEGQLSGRVPPPLAFGTFWPTHIPVFPKIALTNTRCTWTIQIAICLNDFVLIEVCSVEILVACARISTGFKGFLSERRIYVGQTKLLS